MESMLIGYMVFLGQIKMRKNDENWSDAKNLNSCWQNYALDIHLKCVTEEIHLLV